MKLYPLIYTGVSLLSSAASQSSFPWMNMSIPYAQRTTLLIQALNITEKIGLMSNDNYAIDRLQVPYYDFWSEALHGVAWAGVATVFPQSISLGASFDVDLAHAIGDVIAMEARAKHQDALGPQNNTGTFFGLHFETPNINLFRDPRWGRGQETYGEDPILVGTMGASFIQGIQFGPDPTYLKAISHAKHFLAYSLESWDGNSQYRLYFDYNVSTADIQQSYLVPFAHAVEANVSAFMCAYDSMAGVPMCLNPYIQDLLRNQLGFQGYVVSDLGAIDFAVKTHNYTANDTIASALGVKAGTDQDLGEEYHNFLAQALSEGFLTVEDVDLALSRVLVSRFQLGMFDPPSAVPYNSVTMANVSTPASRGLALTAAKEGLVLLKNTNAVLPLDAASLKRVALVGPSANYSLQLVGNYPGCTSGPGSGLISDPLCHVVTLLEALSEYSNSSGFSMTYAQGCTINGNDTSGIPAAIAAAAGADVIIAAMGLDTCQVGQNCSEGEANDRLVTIDFPGQQLTLLNELIATYPGIPIILVMINGGPISSPSIYQAASVQGIIEAWYAGEEGGHAVMQAVFGEFSPAGRLPVTIVNSMEELPLYINISMNAGSGRTHRYYTGKPLFPFGYGLSYTKFQYSGLSITQDIIPPTSNASFGVTVTVTNVGAVVSDEVVQVYTAYLATSTGNASYPLQQLQKFQRLKGVTPSMQQQVSFTISGKDLLLMNPAGLMAVNPGDYLLWVGGCSPNSESYGCSPILNTTFTVSAA